MSRYVDGFVIPLKKKDLKAYTKMAAIGKKTWMKHGALEYFECVGAQLNVPWGTPFTKLCKLKKDETVVFAYVVYKSKTHRDRVNKKVHDEFMKMESMNHDMPFDMKRMTLGEFKTIVHT